MFSVEVVFGELLVDVVTYQRRAVMWWNDFPICKFHDQDDPLLLGDGNYETVMPSYQFYCSMWKQAGIVNPLEYEWYKFDSFDYLIEVLKVLEEQVLIWESDARTSDSLAFIVLQGFVNSLSRLALFVSSLHK